MRTDFAHLLRVVVALSVACFCATTPLVAANVDPAALDNALDALPTFEYGQKLAGLDVIRSAVNESAAQPDLRQQLEKRFMAILQSGSTRAAKDLACRNLGMVGSPACVPTVAALLTDPDLSHMARYCLENLRSPEADAALRDALPKTSGALKMGIISSLGARQDRQALPALIAALNDPAPSEAAAAALGHIGTIEAARALIAFAFKAPAPLQGSVASACLLAAETLRRQGNLDAASEIFQTFYSNQLKLERAERYQTAGLAGLIRTKPQAETQYLLPALSGTNTALRQTAAALVSEPGVKLEPLLAALPNLPVAGQLALLSALSPRPEPAIKTAVLAIFDSAQPDVRSAALSLLASRADATDIPRLARLAATETGTIQQAAHQALVTLPGTNINAMLTGSLKRGEPAIRVELLRCLAARSVKEAASTVASHLQDAQAEVRVAAIEALGALADESQLPALIQLLLTPPTDGEKGAATAAIRSICERTHQKALDAVLAGLSRAGENQKPQFLGFLPVIGGSRGLDAVREAINGTNAVNREAGVRVLSVWPSLDAAPELLALIKNADRELFRTVAFRGYIRLGRESEMPESEKVKYLTTAAEAARTAEQKRLTLSSLGELASPDALQLVTRFTEDAETSQEAGLAAVAIIARFDDRQKAQAAPVLRRVVQSTNPALQEAARKQMTRLGISE